jgi:hypothetical protein
MFWNTIAATYKELLRKLTKPTARTACIWIENWTRDLVNTKEECLLVDYSIAKLYSYKCKF